MTKPHEEKWTAVPLEINGEPCGEWTVESDSVLTLEMSDEAHARLKAQAPAMARLLLALQWADGERACCPSCGAWERDGHRADCELAAVLRAAGVLP